MDEAFVVVSVISGIFGIIGLLILDRNWFRRERFKFNMDSDKKEQTLRFKKMARDLGLDVKTPPFRGTAPGPLGPLSGIGSLIELAKGLSPEVRGELIDRFLLGRSTEESSEEETSPGLFEILKDFAVKNPDLVKGLLDGITKGKDSGESGLL